MKSSALVSLSLLVLATGCSRHENTAATLSLPPASVSLTAVSQETGPQLTEVMGSVRPARHAQLAAKVMGVVTELPVTLGQSVKAGEVLLKISAAEINSRVVQARAQLNVASRDLERERDLLTKGASTAEMVRGLEDRYTMTEAMVHEAETMLGYTEVRAPFDGVVARKFINAGDLAAPGQPLLEIEGIREFEIEAGIPDSLATSLAPGTVLNCQTGTIRFSAKLAEISSAADLATRTVGVKLTVPADAAVRSGQFTRIFVPGPLVTTLTIPTSALSATGQMERVFVLGDDRRASLRLVKSGSIRGDKVEILSGLSAGEKVVLNPPTGLREGQPLEVLP